MQLEKYVIHGNTPLKGEVEISGAKNAAVAILPACLMIDGVCTIENLPEIKDVEILIETLKKLGASIKKRKKGMYDVDCRKVKSHVADYEMIKSMRASYYLIGAFIGRCGKASVAMPGGCNFGDRPIDQHIRGFAALGATADISHGTIEVSSEDIKGCNIYMDKVSVGATINLMLAAAKAKGVTVIENAAKEPHVVDVANFLNAMGAKIKGAGTDIIRITGVESLPGGKSYSIIPDQIEAGTFMVAAAATKGEVVVKNIIPKHMETISTKLIEMGVGVEEGEDWIKVSCPRPLRKANVNTMPYPGFPTDMQPQIAVLMSLAEGQSTIFEGVWDQRFQYITELKRLGADIKVQGSVAIVEGNKKLTGAIVSATDLRAGAAMVVAGLAAEGRTEVRKIKYIDRGYENFEQKLVALGADIKRERTKEEDY